MPFSQVHYLLHKKLRKNCQGYKVKEMSNIESVHMIRSINNFAIFYNLNFSHVSLELKLKGVYCILDPLLLENEKINLKNSYFY